MKYLILVISLFFVFSNSFAQEGKIKKAYKYVEVNKFDKALQTLNSLKKDNEAHIIRDYHISKLYRNKQNHRYSLDTSYLVLKRCEKNIERAGLGVEVDVCDEFQVCFQKIQFIKDSIAWERYYEIRSTNDIEKLSSFKVMYSERLKVIEAAQGHIEYLEYIAVLKSSKIEDYLNYISKYPDNTYKDGLLKKIEELKYTVVLDKNELTEYKAFLIEYPDSEFRGKIEEKIELLALNNVLSKKSIEGCYDFIQNYPSSNNFQKVKRHLEQLKFKKVLGDNNIENIESFINEFPSSQYTDSLMPILDSLMLNKSLISNDPYFIRNYLKKFPKNLSEPILIARIDSLIFILASKSDDYDTIKKLIYNFKDSKHINLLKTKLESLYNEHMRKDFNSIRLDILPGYEEGSLDLVKNEYSFLDNNLNENIRRNGFKHEEGGLYVKNFKSLPNEWYYFNDSESFNNSGASSTLFKQFSGHVKAISSDNVINGQSYLFSGYFGGVQECNWFHPPEIEVGTYPASGINYVRSFFFSDSIVVSPNGYFINVYSNTFIPHSKNGAPIKAFNNNNFKKLKELFGKKQSDHLSDSILNIVNQYPNNGYPIVKDFLKNDSLMIFKRSIEELNRNRNPIISTFPTNKKIEGKVNLKQIFDYTNEYAYECNNCYFFNKYNLTSYKNRSEIPERLHRNANNLNHGEDGDVIIIYNYLQDNIQSILDRNVRLMNVGKISFDSSGQLLIVQSGDYQKEEIIIFDLIDNRQLIAFPGIFSDVNPDNKLIFNVRISYEDDYWKDRNDGVSNIEFDVLNLNELIQNKSKFIAQPVSIPFNIDEFYSNELLEAKMSELEVYFNISNNYVTTIQNKINRKSTSSETFSEVIAKYEAYFDEFQNLYRQNITWLNNQPINLELEYILFDKKYGEWKMKIPIKNKDHLRLINYFNDFTYETGIGNGLSVSVQNDTILRINNANDLWVQQNLNNVTLNIYSHFDDSLDIYSLTKYKGDYKLIIFNCAYALNKSHSDIQNLYMNNVVKKKIIKTTIGGFNEKQLTTQELDLKYAKERKYHEMSSAIPPPGCEIFPIFTCSIFNFGSMKPKFSTNAKFTPYYLGCNKGYSYHTNYGSERPDIRPQSKISNVHFILRIGFENFDSFIKE